MTKAPDQGMKVVTSAVMAPPAFDNMFERRPYITRKDAPATHARMCETVDQDYCLNFNGVDLVVFRYNHENKVGIRMNSDGDFQSKPFIQQFLTWASGDQPVEVEVEFKAPVEMWNIRPQRAKDGEAILGQLGAPLLYGVNGMYFPDWDLLVSWYGVDFSWKQPRVEKTEDGNYSAKMNIVLDESPLVVLVRPHYYHEHLGYEEHQPWKFRPNDKAVTGWCSWEAYHSDVTQKDVEHDAQALKVLKPYGLEYMQLDDGFQQKLIPPQVGDQVSDAWLKLNEKFPDGHKGIVDGIRAGGFEPGIWTNSVLNNKPATEELDIAIKKDNGELMRGDWIVYTMNCLPEMLREQVTPYYKAFRDAGYTYFKSDALRHLIYDGLQEAVRLGILEPEDARARQRAYMEAAREGIGPDAYYLSCWGVLTQSIGICDAMRVATDANPSWGAYSMQLRETARWFFAQRVMFTLDPDHVCVRGDLKWVRMMLSLVSLTGGLFMISDKPSSYDAERLALMQKTMPATAVHTGETGPIDYSTPACTPIPMDADKLSRMSAKRCHITNNTAPFSSLWSIHFDKGGRQWTVVQRAAVTPLEPVSVSLEQFALDPSRKYYAFDFWKQTGFVVDGGALSFDALELGDTTVLALTDITDGVPALVGSDRHVTMDAVSVESAMYANGELVLDLSGFEGLEVRYTIYVPGMRGEAVAEGADATIEKQDDIATVCVKFAGEKAKVVVR